MGVVSWWKTLRVSNLCGLQVGRDLFELRSALPNGIESKSLLAWLNEEGDRCSGGGASFVKGNTNEMIRSQPSRFVSFAIKR